MNLPTDWDLYACVSVLVVQVVLTSQDYLNNRRRRVYISLILAASFRLYTIDWYLESNPTL